MRICTPPCVAVTASVPPEAWREKSCEGCEVASEAAHTSAVMSRVKAIVLGYCDERSSGREYAVSYMRVRAKTLGAGEICERQGRAVTNCASDRHATQTNNPKRSEFDPNDADWKSRQDKGKTKEKENVEEGSEEQPLYKHVLVVLWVVFLKRYR